MAKIRHIKNEVNYLCWELLDECVTYRNFHPQVSAEKVNNIMEEILEIRNDLIHRLNNLPADENKSAMKAHVKAVREDSGKMIASMDKLSDK